MIKRSPINHKINPNILFGEYQTLEERLGGKFDYLPISQVNFRDRFSLPNIHYKDENPDVDCDMEGKEMTLEQQIEHAIRPITAPKKKVEKLQQDMQKAMISPNEKNDLEDNDNKKLLMQELISTSLIKHSIVSNAGGNNSSKGTKKSKYLINKGQKTLENENDYLNVIITPEINDRKKSVNNLIFSSSHTEPNLTHSPLHSPIIMTRNKHHDNIKSPNNNNGLQSRKTSVVTLANSISSKKASPALPFISKRDPIYYGLDIASRKSSGLERPKSRLFFENSITKNIISPSEIYSTKIINEIKEVNEDGLKIDISKIDMMDKPDYLKIQEYNKNNNYYYYDKGNDVPIDVKDSFIKSSKKHINKQSNYDNYYAITDSRDYLRGHENNISEIEHQKIQKKKKEYYNKWYIPVKYWGITKNQNIEHNLNELRFDEAYMYNHLHDNAKESQLGPLKQNVNKDPHHTRHEVLQEKLKQSSVALQFKEELTKKKHRIPAFLKSIIPENQSSKPIG